MTKIAIIGAGLSGRLLALNLARQGTSALSIRMIDRGDTRYMGPAYSNEADYLLLNVRAGQMGAFVAEPHTLLGSGLGRSSRLLNGKQCGDELALSGRRGSKSHLAPNKSRQRWAR
jgi:hypothetical protein